MSKRAVEEGNAFPENTISKTYEWLVELSNSYEERAEKLVCLVANSVANSNVEKVSEILTYCTIPSIKIYIEDLESSSVEDLRSLSMEVDLSRNPETIRNVTDCSSAILVVYDETLEQHTLLRDALVAGPDLPWGKWGSCPGPPPK